MKNPPVVRKLEIRYQDLDPYGHVNNMLHLGYCESLRFAYWWKLAEIAGVTEFDAGDIPGARYVIAEANVRYKAPILFDEPLFGAASVTSAGNRSYAMDFELRAGDSFETGILAAECTMAHVFFDPQAGEIQLRPDWFLPAVSELEGKPEDSFI